MGRGVYGDDCVVFFMYLLFDMFLGVVQIGIVVDDDQMGVVGLVNIIQIIFMVQGDRYVYVMIELVLDFFGVIV